MMYCRKESKTSLETLKLLNGDNVHKITNWEMIKYRLKIQSESQRQFLWFNLVFICFEFHLNSKNFDETWLAQPLPVQYFYIGSDLCGVLMALMIFEIHWIITTVHLIIYCAIQSWFTYRLYGLIANDFVLLCFFLALELY